jgi:hypothetical protein
MSRVQDKAPRGMRSRPDEIRVHGLQPVVAFPALVEAALSLRYDAFDAKLARLGEHARALAHALSVITHIVQRSLVPRHPQPL